MALQLVSEIIILFFFRILVTYGLLPVVELHVGVCEAIHIILVYSKVQIVHVYLDIITCKTILLHMYKAYLSKLLQRTSIQAYISLLLCTFSRPVRHGGSHT